MLFIFTQFNTAAGAGHVLQNDDSPVAAHVFGCTVEGWSITVKKERPEQA